MSCNITVSVSDDFAKEAKRLAKKDPNFKQYILTGVFITYKTDDTKSKWYHRFFI